PARVEGLLRMGEPAGGFLRENKPAAELWYSRDLPAIAARRGLGEVAPYFIDADAAAGAPRNPAQAPVGGLTVLSFPNNHLGYAITWFGLAAMVLAGAAIVARHELRARRRG
ncbi:SURF1 family protein, partial [Bordetella pertussis]